MKFPLVDAWRITADAIASAKCLVRMLPE